jgi:hypothetical protein
MVFEGSLAAVLVLEDEKWWPDSLLPDVVMEWRDSPEKLSTLLECNNWTWPSFLDWHSSGFGICFFCHLHLE